MRKLIQKLHFLKLLLLLNLFFISLLVIGIFNIKLASELFDMMMKRFSKMYNESDKVETHKISNMTFYQKFAAN